MNRLELIALAVIVGVLGVSTVYALGRIMCILNTCIFITEGSGLGGWGISMDSGSPKVIQSSPRRFLGITGVCLIDALIGKTRKNSLNLARIERILGERSPPPLVLAQSPWGLL